MKFDNNIFLEWTHILFPFYLRQQNRNKKRTTKRAKKPQSAQRFFHATPSVQRQLTMERQDRKKIERYLNM